jgi:hypothetical protein
MSKGNRRLRYEKLEALQGTPLTIDYYLWHRSVLLLVAPRDIGTKHPHYILRGLPSQLL